MASYPILGNLTLTGVDEFGCQWVGAIVKGWGAPGGTLSPVQKPRQAGAWAGLSYAEPRPVVIEGTMIAPNATLANLALDRLISAASLDDVKLTIVEESRSLWAMVRRDGAIDPAWIGPSAFTYSVQAAALDPRKFGAPLMATTALPSTTGGLTVPLTVPFTINATTVSGQVSLYNPGNAMGRVLMRIDGPCHGPVITHVGSGLSLVFASSLVLGAGEWIDIDNEARSVLANGQSSRAQYVTARGFSGFEPGPNVFAFTAALFDAGARLTITTAPAYQ